MEGPPRGVLIGRVRRRFFRALKNASPLWFESLLHHVRLACTPPPYVTTVGLYHLIFEAPGTPEDIVPLFLVWLESQPVGRAEGTTYLISPGKKMQHIDPANLVDKPRFRANPRVRGKPRPPDMVTKEIVKDVYTKHGVDGVQDAFILSDYVKGEKATENLANLNVRLPDKAGLTARDTLLLIMRQFLRRPHRKGHGPILRDSLPFDESLLEIPCGETSAGIHPVGFPQASYKMEIGLEAAAHIAYAAYMRQCPEMVAESVPKLGEAIKVNKAVRFITVANTVHWMTMRAVLGASVYSEKNIFLGTANNLVKDGNGANEFLAATCQDFDTLAEAEQHCATHGWDLRDATGWDYHLHPFLRLLALKVDTVCTRVHYGAWAPFIQACCFTVYPAIHVDGSKYVYGQSHQPSGVLTTLKHNTDCHIMMSDHTFNVLQKKYLAGTLNGTRRDLALLGDSVKQGDDYAGVMHGLRDESLQIIKDAFYMEFRDESAIFAEFCRMRVKMDPPRFEGDPDRCLAKLYWNHKSADDMIQACIQASKDCNNPKVTQICHDIVRELIALSPLYSHKYTRDEQTRKGSALLFEEYVGAYHRPRGDAAGRICGNAAAAHYGASRGELRSMK